MVTLSQLSAPQLERLLQAALRDEARGLGCKKVAVEEEVLPTLAGLADGDARVRHRWPLSLLQVLTRTHGPAVFVRP